MTAMEYNAEGPAALAAGGEVVELSLLLPRDEFLALERFTAAEGLTVARFLRRAVRDCLASRQIAAERVDANDRGASERNGT